MKTAIFWVCYLIAGVSAIALLKPWKRWAPRLTVVMVYDDLAVCEGAPVGAIVFGSSGCKFSDDWIECLGQELDTRIREQLVAGGQVGLDVTVALPSLQATLDVTRSSEIAIGTLKFGDGKLRRLRVFMRIRK